MDAGLVIFLLITAGVGVWPYAARARRTFREARAFDAQERKRIGL